MGILQEVSGKPLDRKAALTDEGRRLAAKGSVSEHLGRCQAIHLGTCEHSYGPGLREIPSFLIVLSVT